MNTKKESFVKRLFEKQETSIILILLAMILIFYLAVPAFLSPANIYSVLKTLSFYGIVAVGETLIILAGDIDISVGSTAGLAAVLGTKLMMDWKCFGLLDTPYEWIGVIAIMLLTMILLSSIGFINAFFVVKVNIPPFVATIATLNIARGLVNIITNGVPVYPLPSFFMDKMGQFQIYLSKEGGLSLSLIVFLILCLIVSWLLKHSTWGRNLYATGNNKEVAKLMGINTDRIRFISYVVTAMLAALAGMLVAAFTKQGYPPIGQGWELQVIAACVIGGLSLTGGSGSILGMFCGMCIMNVLVTGLAMIGFNTFLQTSAQGFIILVAVYIDRLRYSRKIKNDNPDEAGTKA